MRQNRPLRALRPLLAALPLVALSCGGSNFNPARYGTVTVIVEGPVSDTQRNWFATALDPLGPDFQAITGGTATIRVIADTMLGIPESCSMRVAYTERIVRLSHPGCFTSESAGRSAIAHAIGHYQLMTHVCRNSNEMPCSPVGTGSAIMNGGTVMTEPDGTITETFVPSGIDSPSGLDLDEYRRTHP